MRQEQAKLYLSKELRLVIDSKTGSKHTSLAMDGSKYQEDYHIVHVPGVHQCYSWDCGLACVSMVLRALGESPSEVYTKDLDAMECGESIWTIDLAYILRRHNIPLEFYTITLGVNSDHSKKPFYQSHFNRDESRVNLLFQKSTQQGICVQERSLTIEELLNHVQQDSPAIVLVNQSYLHCLSCADSKARKCWDCLTLCQKPYCGHFVVLCGFDRTKDLVFYRDPDSNCPEVCQIHTKAFDKARFSDGTDEDVIIILRHEGNAGGLADAGMGDAT
ncbi:hypothetical protein RRG08_018362 [Elysia crispata]|uniref:Guanylyl cyclase n=1 Tax=Elysia crispata TaxID=231223 RepID=A0AAE1D0P4_9GAST|nr:hypothetical protein RRG08_018362 [Elysia crispata]